MKVKELIAKYPRFQVVEMGYPDSIPFTQLPKECNGLYGSQLKKVIDNLEVKGYKAINKPHTNINITHVICGGKKRPNSHYEGILEIYLKSDKPQFKH